MNLFFLLLKLKLLTPLSLLYFFRAKKLHGQNICSLLHYTASRYGNRIVLSDGESKISFKEMYEQVLSLSAVIQSRFSASLLPSVILICSNTLRDVLVHFAIQNLGIKLILINQKTHPVEIKKIIEKLPSGTLVFSSGADNPCGSNFIRIEELFKQPLLQPDKKIISKKYASLNFHTSGTTDFPKLIEKKKGFLYFIFIFTDLIFTTGANKRSAIYLSTPFSHSFGYSVLLCSLVLGKKTVLTNRRDADYIRKLILSERIELLAGVPSSLYFIANSISGLPHCINLVISTGAPMNQVVLKQIAKSFGKNIFGLYGSSESGLSFIATYRHLEQNCCALGRPLRGIHYRLGDETVDGRELFIKSKAANISDSWIATGDRVHSDGKENLSWYGRKDNVIIKNGIKIFAPEIENALLDIPFIEDAFVCGEKHPVNGEIIVAYVKSKDRDLLKESELRVQLSSVLSSIKIPDRFIETENFEYTNTGKKINPSRKLVLE